MKEAAAISGVSVAKLYALANDGVIEFRKFGGRTLVTTVSLVAAIDAAEPWTPSSRAEKAIAARAARTESAWA